MIEEDVQFECPYCGVPNIVRVEPGAGSRQAFTTDCETCCQPIKLDIRISAGEGITIDARCENE